MSNTLGELYSAELEAEAQATRKCLEQVKESSFDWKPHEKSMTMRYLALIVAEIPLWITTMVEQPELDFMKFPHFDHKSTDELVKHFDENMEGARKALKGISDEQMSEPFSLKANGHLIMTMPKKDNIGPSINHWIHHRGQLTVYLRLNGFPVPSIYGPSADAQS